MEVKATTCSVPTAGRLYEGGFGAAIWQRSDLSFNAVAVRARAGALNLVLACAICLALVRPDLDVTLWLSVFLLLDMAAAVLFGPALLSPAGVVGTALTKHIAPIPTPHIPKRFAWSLGGSLALICLLLVLFEVPDVWVLGLFGVLYALTWLDAAIGFCVGCWMYSKLFGCSACRIG